jgi:NitT/TauT family transport system substrate-binding protein
MQRKRIVFLVVVLMLLIASGVQAQDKPKVDQTFFMTFVPNIQFAPVYVALEKGYFADAGINLKIEHGDEPVGVDLIASNQRQFGLVSGEEVIKARANNRPIVFVYQWFQKYPVGIVVSDKSGIGSVKELAGRKVGIPGKFGASYNGLTALLIANKLTETDIQLDSIGFNAPDVFCVGAVEAAVVYMNNEPLQIQNRADAGQCNGVKSLKVFPVYDAAKLVSNGLVTNEETIAKNPDLVKAMVGAFDKGLHDAVNNPAEAYLLSTTYVENLPLSSDFKASLEAEAAAQIQFLQTKPDHQAIVDSRALLLKTLQTKYDAATTVQLQVLLNTVDLWDADRLGYSELASWEITQKTLQTMKFLSAPIDLKAAFSNAFLPAMEQ